MKMARMVLRCGLVVLLCIALTPFCVLADEGTAVSEPVSLKSMTKALKMFRHKKRRGKREAQAKTR